MTTDIILDSHTFNTDTTLLAQYEGGSQDLPPWVERRLSNRD